MLSVEQNSVVRCAIYTRKSHEEGLEQEFNSLDAQRDSAEAYIASQKMRGWIAMPERYDDGGFSGGTMERPALKQLLADIDAGKIDLVITYKLDRLSRSLLDFMKMIEYFNECNVSFVSVTQQFSTTDPTGRMFLGILITFAQYEREVIGERIRDKVAGAKKRGKYCGGPAVFGYTVDRKQKKLLIDKKEAPIIQTIFKRYAQLGSARGVARELNKQGIPTKSWTTKKGKRRVGREWNTSHIYNILNNHIYLGEVVHKGTSYPGEHDAIISRIQWDKVKQLLDENNRIKISKAKTKSISPFTGVLRCGHCGCSMGITYTKKKDRNFTYYICEKDAKRAVSTCPLKRIPAGDIEQIMLEQLSAVFRTPTVIARTLIAAQVKEQEEYKQLLAQRKELESKLTTLRTDLMERMLSENQKKDAKQLQPIHEQITTTSDTLEEIKSQLDIMESGPITEQDVIATFNNVETFWEDLFPLERNRLVQLLVETIKLTENGITMTLKTQGIEGLIAELKGFSTEVEQRSLA